MNNPEGRYEIRCLCELMEDPVGIDRDDPRITWMADRLPGKQKGYRVIVGLDEKTDQMIWDSGLIFDEKVNTAVLPGKILRSAQRYYYRVELLLADAEEGSEAEMFRVSGPVCTFFTGILEKEEPDAWGACWVGGAGLRNHSYLLRFPFSVDEDEAGAAVFVASPNYYYASLDGKPLCGTVLQPVFTDASKSIRYDTYPLTLCPGMHVLGLEIGNGWHAMDLGERHVAKNEHIAALRICLRKKDGTLRWISSSPENCFISAQAPSVYNNIYRGETRDERRSQPGFDTPDFLMRREDGWAKVFEMDGPDGEVMARAMEPAVIRREMAPVCIYSCPDGSFTADFGQNFAGWVRIRSKGTCGQKIVLRFAELINEDHTINDSSLNGLHVTDTFIFGNKSGAVFDAPGSAASSGRPKDGEEVFEYTFEPRFTWHGFRYVQIEGLSQKPAAGDVTGCVISSDVARISTFSADDPALEWYYHAMLWTEQSNLMSIPSDCPQRAERVAWLNDMTVRNECALYNYRLPSLYRKWCRDIRDTQGRRTGAIADTAPYYRNGQKPADPVASSFLMVPWNVYCHYGDTRILEENVDACVRWVRFLHRHSDEGIVRYCPMGDWASPKKWCDPNSIGAGSVSAITPTVYMATGFVYLNCCLIQKMMMVLGREQDAAVWKKEAEKAAQVFRNAYARDGYFGTGSQGCNAFALWLGLADETTGEAQKVLEHLLQDLRDQDMHLTTGNLCSRFVVEVLFRYGYADEALEVLTQKTYPGWGFMMENGATTLWERWEKVDTYEGVSKMASYNHAMSGAAAIVLHKYLLGISVDEEHPGFARFTVDPKIPEKLNRAEGSLQTVRGRAGCRWEKKENGALMLEVDVPFGTEAEIALPAFDENGKISNRKPRRHVMRPAGSWRFELTPGSRPVL